jgi:hypothetical protein
MNLFILSLNPELTAKYMMDKHIAKIILEAVQMLCTTKRLLSTLSELENIDPCVYKIAHKNHPVTIWCRASHANFVWTLDLIDAMHTEWKYRYGHPQSKQHKSYIVAQYLRNNIPDAARFEKIQQTGIITPFALAMPDECKVRFGSNDPAESSSRKRVLLPTGISNGENSFDAVASYRKYYLSEQKRRIAKWGKKRGMPAWYAKGLELSQSQSEKHKQQIKFKILS